MDDPQDVGVAFWTRIHAFAISEEPPPPDSPLARVRGFTAEYPSVELTEERIGAAVAGRPLLP